jgi:hypothetical protein
MSCRSIQRLVCIGSHLTAWPARQARARGGSWLLISTCTRGTVFVLMYHTASPSVCGGLTSGLLAGSRTCCRYPDTGLVSGALQARCRPRLMDGRLVQPGTSSHSNLCYVNKIQMVGGGSASVRYIPSTHQQGGPNPPTQHRLTPSQQISSAVKAAHHPPLLHQQCLFQIYVAGSGSAACPDLTLPLPLLPLLLLVPLPPPLC